METIADMLTAGGHTNSLGRSAEVIGLLQNDAARLGELFDCVFSDDAWVRMRAIDSFEKVCRAHPACAEPFLDQVFERLLTSTQPSIQWHLAQIFIEVPLAREQQERAVMWLKGLLATTDADWIVAANAMKSLRYFQARGLVDHDDLSALLRGQAAHRSNAVRRQAARLLEELERTGAGLYEA